MFVPIAVEARPGYRLWLRYADGVEGTVDLSRFAGRGVSRLWNRAGAFEQVYLGAGGAIAWSDEVELCPDALYLEITGKKPEQLFPTGNLAHTDA